MLRGYFFSLWAWPEKKKVVVIRGWSWMLWGQPGRPLYAGPPLLAALLSCQMFPDDACLQPLFATKLFLRNCFSNDFQRRLNTFSVQYCIPVMHYEIISKRITQYVLYLIRWHCWLYGQFMQVIN